MKKNSRPRSSPAIRNPFYEDLRKHGIIVDVQSDNDGAPRPHAPGRPRRGEIRLPTAVRSVRLPKALWELVQAQARREHISINAAMRQAAQIWIRS
jgi:hypothetical protein